MSFLSMKLATIVLLAMLVAFCTATSESAAGNCENVEQCFAVIFDSYVKGKLNRLPNPVMTVEGTKPLDVTLQDTDLSHLTFFEKKRLVFYIALTIPHLDAAAGDTFRFALGKDASRVAKEVSSISDDDLRSRFFFSSERIKDFRSLLESLQTGD